MKHLWIENFNTPWITFGGLDVDTVERHGAFVMCRASARDVELILLEFEDAELAARLEYQLKSGASICVEEEREPDVRSPEQIETDRAAAKAYREEHKAEIAAQQKA